MKVIFKLKEPKSKVPTLVYMIFSYEYYEIDKNGNKKYKPLKLSTGEKINPKLWVDKPVYRAKETKKNPEYPEFNSWLSKMEITIKNALRRLKNDGDILPSPEKLKIEFYKELGIYKPTAKITLIEFIKDYIEEVKHIKEENTIKKYNTTKKHLEEYCTKRKRKIDFEDINIRFYNDFHKYLVIENKMSDNSFGKYIATLKGFMTAAIERNHTKNLNYKKFKVLKEEVDKIYLNDTELSKIAKLKLSKNQRLREIRDLFLLECYLGLRFSDLTALKKEDIQITDKGMIIVLKTKKTSEPVVIPVLYKKAKEILEKYDYNLPNKITNQAFNKNLKTIGKLAKIKNEIPVTKSKGGKEIREVFKKWQLITSHTSRRSFATNMYLKKIDIRSIMLITGHRTESSFRNYIRISRHESAVRLLEKESENK